LGGTCSELELDVEDGYHTEIHCDKTRFSMSTAEVLEAMNRRFPGQKIDATLVGIESHICVSQTALDLLRDGHRVYVIADGVSSCNKEEIPIALARLRAAGAVVTSSESWIYEVVGDASQEQFKAIASLVKESKKDTKDALASLC